MGIFTGGTVLWILQSALWDAGQRGCKHRPLVMGALCTSASSLVSHRALLPGKYCKRSLTALLPTCLLYSCLRGWIVIGWGGIVLSWDGGGLGWILGGIFSPRGWWRTEQEAVDAPSLEAFKARLDVALGSLVCWLATLHIAGSWNQMVIVVLFNPGHPMILWYVYGEGLFLYVCYGQKQKVNRGMFVISVFFSKLL